MLREYVVSENHESAIELTKRVVESKKNIASSDDYHNWAVDLAELNLYEKACEVLERGLIDYPSSVELLADYLYYSCEINCPQVLKKSREIYDILQSISEEIWTWRAYSFSIEFLLNQRERKFFSDSDEYEGDIERIIDAYYKKFPNDERPYLIHSRIYMRIDEEKKIKILEAAHEKLKTCPICSLRYADVLINNATGVEDYHEIQKYLDKALTQKSDFEVDHGYIYFLRGLCLIHILNENKEYDNANKVQEIYSCFKVAEDDIMRLLPRNIRIMRKEIRILEILSGIRY